MSRTCALNISVHFQDDVQKRESRFETDSKGFAQAGILGCCILIAGVWEGTDVFVSASIVGGNF